LLTLPGHFAGIERVLYSPDGRFLATAGQDNAVKLWDATTGRELKTVEASAPLAFSPDGTKLALTRGTAVQLLSVPDGQLLQSKDTGRRNAFAVAFTPDGGHLVLAYRDGALLRWDMDNGHEPVKASRAVSFAS